MLILYEDNSCYANMLSKEIDSEEDDCDDVGWEDDDEDEDDIELIDYDDPLLLLFLCPSLFSSLTSTN